MEFTTLEELITYQTDLVSRNLTKFVKDDSSKNKKELIKTKVQLDAYIKVKELTLK